MINRGHFYCPHVKPVLIDCNFVVDASNANGLGIRSLKGQGVQDVFMHTSSTPAVGNSGLMNPNPGNGIIIVKFAENYNRYYGGFSGFVSPVSGTPILVASAGVTANLLYTIVTVGTTTQAGWQSLGLPAGVTAAVGATFVATSTTTATGTGVVEIPAAIGSGIVQMDVIGDPNTTINPIPMGQSPHVGGWLFARCLAATNSSTTTLVATAPAAGSSSTSGRKSSPARLCPTTATGECRWPRTGR